jgi:RHS repeat-associated protein
VLSYDAAGRPTGLSGGTAGTDGLGYVMSSSYTYDIGSTGTGRLTESDDPQATTSYTYVPSGDLASRTIVDPADSFSTRTNYSYGTSGRLSTLASGQYNGNTAGTITATGAENLTYNYDGNGLGQLVSESISGKTPSSCAGTVASTTVYCYDADGRTSSEKTTDSNSTLIYATAATYTPAGQTATLTKKTPDTSTTNANSTGYNSDSGGRSYTYQGNGTLHSSTVTEPSSLPDAYTEYDWDADGDPSGVKVGATSAGPFPINSTYQYVTNGGNETDEIATYTSGGNVTTVTHDAAGDETGDTGGTNPTATSYKYDNFGQLKSTSWTGSGGVTTTNSLGYDALGRLSRATQGTSSSVFYDYDGLSNNVADSSAATLMVGYVQDPDGDTTGDEVGTNAAQRYITDMHGDLAAKTDTSAGNIDNSIIYNANGQYRSAATSTPPQTFQSDLTTVLGKQSSEPNTLITMGTRQYAPAQTQFLTPDQNIGDLTNPISQNRYAYADNSPLDNDDPTGNAAEPTQDASPDAPSAGTGQSLLDPPTSTGGPSQAGPSTSADWGSAANGSCISDQPESVAGQFYINQESRFRQPEVCGGAGPSMYNPSTSPISDAGDDMYVLDLGAEIAAAIAGGYDEDPDLDLLDPTWYGDGLDASASQAATPPYTMDDDRYNDAIALVNDPFFDLPSYSPNMSAVLSASVPIDLGASVVDDLTNGPAFSPPVASLPAPIDAATWLREAISPLPGPPAGIQDTQFFGKNTEVSLTAAYYREYRARRAKGPIVRRNTVPSRSEGYQREYRARRVGDTPSAQLFEVAQLWADAVAASNARPILAVMNRFNMASTNAWTLVSRARQAGLIPPAVRDPAFSREDIAQVWADAVAASDPDPVSAVMNLFQLTRPGARRWIGRARSAGLIPPKG